MKKLLTIIMTALTVFSASGVQAGTETLITPTVITPGISLPFDSFGIGVDMAEDVAIVGTAREDGAAFIYENEQNRWTEKAVLIPGKKASKLSFYGNNVAVSEKFAAVSGDYESGYEKAYVFQKPAEGWSDMNANAAQVLSLYHTEYQEVRIHDLSLHGNTLVICYIAKNQNEWTGYFNIYDYNGREWLLSETIISENQGGYVADVYENRVIVDSSSAALIYRRNENGRWEQEACLTADDSESTNVFGHDVAISEDVAVVGDSKAYAAYIFEYDGTQWIQKQKLTESRAESGGIAYFYGRSLDITRNYVLIGSLYYLDDNLSGDNVTTLCFCGAAFLYKRDENNAYVKVGKYLAPNPQSFRMFGRSAALSDSHFIVGHPHDQFNGTDGSTVIEYGGSAVIYNLFAPGDFDRDGCVGKNDAAILRTFLNRPLIECPECDLDGDGRITVLDARKLVGFCTNADCECH